MRFRSMLFACSLAAACVAAVPSSAPAQQSVRELAVSDTVWQIRLDDGTEVVGRVVSVEEGRITLETVSGVRVDFATDQIREVRVARGRVVRGEYWAEDPNTSRLFVGPTARTVPRGRGYFGVLEVFIPFVGYGVTDELTVLGGSPFYLALAGEGVPPFYIAPKLRVYDGERLDLAAGALAVFVPWDDADLGLGVAYGIGTWGTPDRAVSAGLGWGYADGGFSAKPVAMIGFEERLGRSTKLITENWFVPGEDGALLSGGIRFFGSRLSADAGLVWAVSSDGFEAVPFPLVNFVYSFGGR